MSVMWQPGMTLASLEKNVILEALRFYHGNKTQTALGLGIAVRTLQNKLTEYGVVDERPRKLQRTPEEIERSKQNGLAAKTGSRVEPANEAPKKQSVSMWERAQVQGMPSSQHATGISKKRQG